MSFNTMTDAELQKMASEPGAVGVQARSALRDRQVALCAVCSTPLEGGSDSGVPFPPVAEGKRAHVRCVSMPRLRQATEEMAREDSERGRYARKRLGEIEQYERRRAAAAAASAACDAVVAKAGSGTPPEPQPGDYVRWVHPFEGTWIEGELVAWAPPVKDGRMARLRTERGLGFAIGYEVTVCVERAPLRKIDRPTFSSPVVHVTNHYDWSMTPEHVEALVERLTTPKPLPTAFEWKQCFPPPTTATAGNATYQLISGGTSATFAASPVEAKAGIVHRNVKPENTRRPDGFTQFAVDAAKAVLLSVGTAKVRK